jgi:hypothetical protein
MHQSGIRDAPLSQVAQRTKARFQEFSRKLLESSGDKFSLQNFSPCCPEIFGKNFRALADKTALHSPAITVA